MSRTITPLTVIQMRMVPMTILAGLLFISCYSPIPYERAKDLQGQRLVYDEYYRLSKSGHGGITVTLEPFALSQYDKRDTLTTTTDADGNWRFPLIDSESYLLTFSRPDCIPVYFRVSDAGGKRIGDPGGIFQRPSHRVSDISARLVGDSIEVTGKVTKRAIAGDRGISIFVGRDESVSSALEPRTHFTSQGAIAYGDDETFTSYISLLSLEIAKIRSGRTVYIRAYPAVITTPYFTRNSLGGFIHGPEGSNIIGFTMP